jgi:polyisoprenoid-binding protein YceI
MASLSEFFSDPASTGTWTLVAEQSTILVKSKSFWGLATVKVPFTDFSGEGQITAPQTVSGGLTVNAASIRTGIGRRDNHLRSAEFFDVERFPDINVMITGAEAVATDTVNLRAELTVKDTTKPLTLTTTVTAVGDGGMRLRTQATINRREFGVDGDMIGMMSDDATISGDVVFRPAG